MQSHQLQCHIRAFAVLAEMEAMKAENENRTRRNEAQAYNENNFFALSNRLEELACEALTDEEQQIKIMRDEANHSREVAEKAWYKYACSLPFGRDRERAFEIYKNVRMAQRILAIP